MPKTRRMAASLLELFFDSSSVERLNENYKRPIYSSSKETVEELYPFSSDRSDASSYLSSNDQSSSSGLNSSTTSATTAPPIVAAKNVFSDLRANSDRLWNDLQSTAQWGQIGDTTGMARLALSDADKSVRDWFVSEAESIGCEVRVDKIGNIFAIYPGENTDLAPIGIGSHLDTQPAGGMYDGILGCLAGLEVVRTIHASGIKPYCSVAAIVWTNEEGARFNPGCSGSAVWSGSKTLSSGHAQEDVDGLSIKSELSRIGYLGPYFPDYRLNPLSAHFELHIEQGSKLEDSGRRIGVVNGVQGIRWYKATVTGVRAHAGSTKMADRSDALVATARIVTLLDKVAREQGGVATVGMLELERPSSNTIPGSTSFTIDIRHPSEEGLNHIEEAVRNEMSTMTMGDERMIFEITQVWESAAARFDHTALSCIRAAALEEVGEQGCMEMDSLAGHDSALVSKRVPTAMIFVQSKDGLSHAPDEFTSQEDCGYGLQVLLSSVMRYDAEMRKAAS